MKTLLLRTAGFGAFILAAMCATTPTWAQSKATSLSNPDAPINPSGQYNGGVDAVTMPDDARMAVFTYSRDQIFRVITAPLKLTTIEFEKGEQLITDPAMGDSVRWIIDTDGANHVYVKPNQPNLVNTLHLSTNKREYDFTLVSSPLGGLFYQSVRFSYPQSLMDKVHARQGTAKEADGNDPAPSGDQECSDSGNLGIAPENLDFKWTIRGSGSFKPSTVFDNGKNVWILLPPDTTFPVPVIKLHGDTITPNFIRRCQYLVVQQMADEIDLRAGDDEVTLTHGHHGLFGW
ncbi:MAG: TrbG/VirB9 family P-type conjugative transfer protein [Pseudomonadota bacterium]